MQAEQGGGAQVAPVAAQQGDEAGEQAALLFVEQAAEQGDGSGHGGLDELGLGRRREGLAGFLDAAGSDLQLLAGGVGRAVQGAAAQPHAGQLVVAGQQGEGVDAADTQQGVEFGGAEAGAGGADEGPGGGAQGAVGGEADTVVVC